MFIEKYQTNKMFKEVRAKYREHTNNWFLLTQKAVVANSLSVFLDNTKYKTQNRKQKYK